MPSPGHRLVNHLGSAPDGRRRKATKPLVLQKFLCVGTECMVCQSVFVINGMLVPGQYCLGML